MTDTREGSLAERLQELVGKPYGAPSVARDPVNVPMIRHLTDALGDRNPCYADEEFARGSVHGGIVAPATSLQVWTMPGLAPRTSAPDADSPQNKLMGMLDEAGYVGVVATNCEQTYHRYLRPGDLLSVSSTLESITGPKKTGLGEGYFITTLQTYRDQQGEVVGEMRFRILKFIPKTSGSGGYGKAGGAEGDGQVTAKPPAEKAPELPTDKAPELPPPPIDSAFFWEGLEQDELRIQRCSSCGKLRHPPRPMCPYCRSLDHDFVVSSGRGEVYSYVVHHKPPVPGRDHPFVVALVELEEGTRVVGNLVGCPPEDVEVGTAVQVEFATNEQGRRLPQWRRI